jgi:hypothetical protein
MGIEIVSFRKLEKKTLIGFCTVRLTNAGLEIRDATVHQKDGKKWVNLPSRPYEKEDGFTGYSYIVKFVDKDRYFQFQKAVLQELDKYLSREIENTPEQDIPF